MEAAPDRKGSSGGIDEEVTAVARDFLEYLDANPDFKVEAREALYDIYQQWCRDQGLPSRAFGSVLYKSREMGRLFVIKGEEIRWNDQPGAEGGKKLSATSSRGRLRLSRNPSGSLPHSVDVKALADCVQKLGGSPHLAQLSMEYCNLTGRRLKTDVGEDRSVRVFLSETPGFLLKQGKTMSDLFVSLVPSDNGVGPAAASAVSPRVAPEVGFRPVVATGPECRQACELLRGSSTLALVVKPVHSRADLEAAGMALSSGGVSLIQLASRDFVFLFDVISAPELYDAGLREILEDQQHRIAVFGAFAAAKMLGHVGVMISSLFDVQMLDFALNPDRDSAPNMHDMLRGCLGHAEAPLVAHKLRWWQMRPLTSEATEMASLEVTSLYDASNKMAAELSRATLDAITKNSSEHAVAGLAAARAEKKGLPEVKRPHYSLDIPPARRKKESKSPRAASAEPLSGDSGSPPTMSITAAIPASRAAADSAASSVSPRALVQPPVTIAPAAAATTASAAAPPLTVVSALDVILHLLPAHVAEELRASLPEADGLALDVMQAPLVLRADGLGPFRLKTAVTKDELQQVATAIGVPALKLQPSVSIGESLHLCHPLLDAAGEVCGLTLRVGRVVAGWSDMLSDLMRARLSLLFVGFGKSTMLRDCAARLTEHHQHCVVAVDTRGSLGGLSEAAHASLGGARRLLPRAGQQNSAIVDAVVLHGASTVVVDEVGTEIEAAALQVARQRGVQVLAGTFHRTREGLRKVAPSMLANFDAVVHVMSPFVCRVIRLDSAQVQLRTRTRGMAAYSQTVEAGTEGW